MKIQILARAALAAALLVPFVASADNGGYGTNSNNMNNSNSKESKLSDSELQTLAYNHRVNLMEIDMGKLAVKKGTSAAIKKYGGMLIKDHTDADNQASAIAKAHGQSIPKQLPTNEDERSQIKNDQDAYNRLKTEKGADFDRDFVAMAVQGHEETLARIDSAIGQVTADDLKSFLENEKPTLQKHLDEARDLQKNNAQAIR